MLSRDNILESVYASLDRLGCDHLDLLYFHRYDAFTPVEESLSAVEDLVQRDLVRHFGVSNFTPGQLKLYRQVEQQLSVRARIIAVQNRFNVLTGEQAPGVLDWCASSAVSYVAYSPLATGFLSERYLEPEQAARGDRLVDEKVLDKMATRRNLARLKKLATAAQKAELSISELALAYTLTLRGMGPPIPSATTLRQLESNAAAAKTVLEPEIVARMQKILR